MPRQRTRYRKITYVFPEDFPPEAEAVQGGSRPVVQRAGSPYRDQPLHRKAMGDRGPAYRPEPHGVAGAGRPHADSATCCPRAEPSARLSESAEPTQADEGRGGS